MKYILVGIKDSKLIANAFVESQNNKISPTKIGYLFCLVGTKTHLSESLRKFFRLKI